MKRILCFLIILGLVIQYGYPAPSNNMSITPTATSGSTITAADENARNSAISTAYNAHDHQDFTLTTSNSLTIGDGLAGDKNLLFNDDGAASPGIRFDDSLGYIVVSDDGTNWSTHSLYSGTVQVAGDVAQNITGEKQFLATRTIASQVVASCVVLTGSIPVAKPSVNTLYSENIVKAWAVVNQISAQSIIDSFNLSSITDSGTVGRTTFTWKIPFANNTYVVVGTAENSVDWELVAQVANQKTVSSVQMQAFQHEATLTDVTQIMVIAIGEQARYDY